MKKYISLLLALTMAMSLSACGKKSSNVQQTSAELPTVTSAELGCYIVPAEDGSKSVVDKTGKAMDGYTVDETGNVVNDQGKIAVAADKVAEFVYVTGISFGSEASINVAPDTDLNLTVTVEPEDATNKDYTLTSDNTDAVAVTDNKAAAVADGEATVTAKPVAAKDDTVNASATVTVKSATAPEIPETAPTAPNSSGNSSSTTNTGASGGGAASPSPAPTPTADPDPQPAAHKHHWEPVYVTKTVDVYETQIREICKGCGTDIADWSTSDRTAHAEAHMAAGEQSGWYDKAVDVKIGTEEGAYTDHFVCTICGATNYDTSKYPD